MYRVSTLISRLKSETVSFDIIKKINKMIRETHFEKNLSLNIPSLRLESDLHFEVYADASLGNNSDGSTQGGFIIFLHSSGKRIPLAWQSRKLKRIVHSTLAAETLALSDGIDAAIVLRDQMQEGICKKLDIFCFTDNKSLLDSINSLKNVSERRLRSEIAGIREVIGREALKVQHVQSGLQLADALTKDSKSASSKLKSFVLM